jgi:hypothetical protein
MPRKLTLKKATLTELGTDDLASIAGGPQPTPPVFAPTYQCTGYYLTVPVDRCLHQR